MNGLSDTDFPDILISPSPVLGGEWRVPGAKNSALPSIVLALFHTAPVTLLNVPDIVDVRNMVMLLDECGISVSRESDTMTVFPGSFRSWDLTLSAYFSKLRYSMLLVYPILKQFGRCRIPVPGGCPLGRSIECHMEPLRWIGYEVVQTSDYTEITQKDLVAGPLTVRLDPRRHDMVGMTSSLYLSSFLIDGGIEVENPAVEPEMVEMMCLMRLMAGASDPLRYSIIPDRIDVASLLGCVSAGLPGSSVHVYPVIDDHVQSTIDVFRTLGLIMERSERGGIYVSNGDRQYRGVDIVADEFPRLPTDVQPIVAAVATFAGAESRIRDRVFPDRFHYIPEYLRIYPGFERGTDYVKVRSGCAFADAEVRCSDLRAAMGLVILAIGSCRMVRISNTVQLHRGYADILSRLRGIGVSLEEAI